MRLDLHSVGLGLGLTATLVATGCPGDDGSDDSTTASVTTTATDTDAPTTGAESTGGETTSTSPSDCAELTTPEACAAAELEPGLEACIWRSTTIVDPMACGTSDGPGACFTATNLDGCYSQVPDSCGDGQAWFYRELPDGTFEMFEDSSMCAGSDPFLPCEGDVGGGGTAGPVDPAAAACTCGCESG